MQLSAKEKNLAICTEPNKGELVALSDDTKGLA